MQADTGEALGRVRAGDSQALGDLLVRYMPRLYLLIEHLTRNRHLDADQKEEILSEVLLQAIESVDAFEYRGNGSFYSWLARIARNRVLDAGRRADRGVRGKERLTSFRTNYASLADTMTGVLTRAHRAERIHRIAAVLDSLDEEHSSLLSLVHLEGLSVKEAAESLGLSQSTAHDRFLRAAKAFRIAWQR